MEHRRRQYPAYAYQQAAGPGAAGGAPTPSAPEYGAEYVPAVDSVAERVDGLTLGGVSAAPMPAGAPVAPQAAQAMPAGGFPGYGAPQMSSLPLNGLYQEDLLQQLPPPVNDLDLPPPPLQVPPEKTVSQSPYAQASPEYMRCTLNTIPTTGSLLKRSKLPFALIVRPTASLLSADEHVPVVNDTVIARCRRCRTYINPFVEFVNAGSRWKCSMCHMQNDVPSGFDYDVFESRAVNRYERPELNYGVVDFIAPKEYLTRPPQPPVYVFVLDASVSSLSAGLLSTASRVIKESLDKLPNIDGRTRVAFLAVDGSLNYFQIPLPNVVPGTESPESESYEVEESEPRMMVVGDLENPFLPTPTGLLVNLKESRKQIDALLDQIPQIFSGSPVTANCLGSALKASLNMIQAIGGKIICITATLPNVGIAALHPRGNDAKLAGTAKEKTLFQPADSFYKSFAVDCNRHLVSVDMFLLAGSYQDVASLSCLPKYTGGSTYYYPGWAASRPTDVLKFQTELGRHLSKEISAEGMMRVRSSSGVHSCAHSGHFFVRQSDLMFFSGFPRDHSYAIEMSIDETLSRPYIVVQAALLHTTAFGERRIRVITQAIPTSDQLQAIYASADQQALATFYAHQASQRSIDSGLATANEWLLARTIELFKTFKTEVLKTHAGSTGALLFPSNLKLLPLLLLGLKKTVALRRAPILSDLRVNALNLLETLPTAQLIKYVYPDFYALHDLPDEAGLPDEQGTIVLPSRLNLSGQSLVGHGLYLIDDGQVIFLWASRDVVPQLLEDAFGVSTLAEVPVGKTELPVVDSDLNERLRNIIAASRERIDSVYFPSLYIVTDSADSALRVWVSTMLVEDRSEADPTYHQFLNEIREKISN